MYELRINVRNHLNLKDEEMETVILKGNFIPRKGETIILHKKVFNEEKFTVLNVGYIQADNTLEANIICMHNPPLKS